MDAIFVKNKQSGEWNVLARPGLPTGAWVMVSKSNGKAKRAQIDQCIGQPFTPDWGPFNGQEVCRYTTFYHSTKEQG